jgi:hypothetical protein
MSEGAEMNVFCTFMSDMAAAAGGVSVLQWFYLSS